VNTRHSAKQGDRQTTVATVAPIEPAAGLSGDDVSAVIRLVLETCDRWDDPLAWREHLLHGACRLLGGHVGTMLADPGGRKEAFGRVSVVSVVGLPPPLRERVQPAVSKLDQRSYVDAAEDFLPGMCNLYGEIVRQGWVTASRSQVADDDAYYAARYYRDFRRPADCDDYVVSIRLVDVPLRAEAITVDRPHGAPRFGPREVTLLKLLHDEVAPLIGVRLATESHLCRDGLSKRLNETLSLLLDGRSEKEAARSLRISTRTLHDYVTMLYRHFRVSSRAELLAYFVRRTPEPRHTAM
jgi:DNA-binding CsgD family transcriptional regulator